MNFNEVLPVLRKKFNVREIDTDIARCEKVRQETVIAIYYFVFGERCLDQQFNLKEFQDKLLAEDYYTHPGWLQWNYYLVFVVPEVSGQNEARKRVIEEDRVYTRKYVVPALGLRDFLAEGSSTTAQTENAAEDVLSRWVRKLDAAGLSDVYGSGQRGKIIDAVIEGENQPIASREPITELLEAVTAPGRMNELTIKEFRPHPIRNGPFKFGQVNLICGPNGVGKTSLMEAIELMYCGAVRRNHSDLSAVKISAKFQGLAAEDEFDSTDLQKYKRWSQHWYGRAAFRRGPGLANHFGRHNFFDSDAAFRMTDQEDAEPLKEAFAAIALGEKVNVLEKRLAGFRDDLKQRRQLLEADAKSRKSIVKEHEELILRMANVPAKSANLLGLLGKRLEAIGVKRVTVESIDAAHQLILGACDALREATTNTSWLKLLSLNSLRTEFRVLTEQIDALRVSDDDIAVRRAEIGKLHEDIQAQEERAATLDTLAPYFNLAPGELEKLGQQIRDLESEQDRLERSAELVDGIDLTAAVLNGKSATLRSIIDGLAAETDAITAAVRERVDAETRLQSTVAELDRVLAEIRNLGGRYVTISPNSSQCPLCGQAYSAGELKGRFEKHSVRTHVSGDLQKLKDERQGLESKLAKAKTDRKVLEQLDEAISIARAVETVVEEDIRHLVAEARGLRVKARKAADDLSPLSRRQASFDASGLSMRGLTAARTKLKSILPAVSIDSSGREAYSLALKEIRGRTDALTKDRDTLDVATREVVRVTESRLAAYLGSEENLDALRDELLNRNRAVERSLSTVLEASKDLPYLADVDLRVALQTLTQVESNIGEYLNARKDEGERSALIDSAKREAAAAKQVLLEIQPRFDRCNKAFTTLEELLTVDSKEAALKTFLDQNIDNVSRIFRSIHSPREFSGLKSDHLALQRTNGEEASLSNISTGQRAALGLSVFLSLNFLLKDGPPVILIDDPVAHVDDLNALSFLDFLRNAVLDKDRQVFLSTASTKLAELFRRKFEFLGKEFVEIKLSR